MLRTKTCGELRSENVGEDVTLCGWVDGYRDHNGVVFIDLRDRYGITQVAFKLDLAPEIQEQARKLRNEDVLRAKGTVVDRGENENPKLDTGKIEIHANELEIYSKSKTPPFEPGTQELPNEELRLKYRFIDLRRKELHDALAIRHRVCKITRDYFDAQGFMEIETPMLGRSTPEGARDYLVPSRVHPGAFYALPQSPQIYKQILMVAGYDRYYQLARCFRDEDLRADRQPEFTQIDVEMAFVDREDIFSTIDGLVGALVEGVRGTSIPLPLPRISYHDAMERFGSDKPDLRFDMELVDVGETVADCEFGVFKNVIAGGGRVRGMNAKGAAEKYSRKNIDGLTAFVGDYGAKGWRSFVSKPTRLANFVSTRPSPSFSATNISGRLSTNWTAKRATCCSSSPTSPPSLRPRWERCGFGSVASWSCTIRRKSTAPGSSTFRWSPGTKTKTAGTPSITRSAR